MTEGFWDHLGMDEGGLPIHLPMGVDSQGRGPMEPQQPHHYECWCPDPNCMLTKVLAQSWRAGARQMSKRRSSTAKIHLPPREHPDSGKPVF